ncbi:hypothetical protein [Streptacidiphilus monticola]|uniref:Uncharacterized protein n=1 Tax=Streptacidiphilus monticola TaxID=2161674 RepID=A0ABW1G483_9ACTN
MMIVTAPAAVGKSTAASFLSFHLKAPVLDLSTLQVGDATLEGSLSKALGAGNFARYLDRMVHGAATLIVDALDEAEVRSGQANFRAFIRGVADTASAFTGKPAVVILSRAESSQALVETLEERRIPFAQFEILPFNREQAEHYLDGRISDIYSASGREMIHKKHREPFTKARDALFKIMASALSATDGEIWEVPAVRDFLGYAPVLDVAAEFLAVDNFATVSRDFSSKAADRGLVHWDMVSQVIDHLLVREQEKFVAQFSKTPEFIALDDPRLAAALYTPEEQCARLLDYVENMRIPMDLPGHLPAKVREPYETAVSAQLANHPFLRGSGWFNVIFRDYVTARAISSASTSADTGQAIRRRLLSAEWKHSPMFGYFTFTLSRAVSEDVAQCHSELLGALYESFKSMCDSRDTLRIIVGKSGNRLIATFAVLTEIDTGSADSGKFLVSMGPLGFVTHEGTIGISFPRELSHADIYEVPEVTLGGDGGSFKLGPQVYISCGELLVLAKEVHVHGEASKYPVLLNLGSLTSEHVNLKAEPEQLIVVCDELFYPWSQHQKRVNLDELRSNSREAYWLYVELRRIVLRFKDAKAGEVALYQPFLDNLVIGENRRARIALDFLQDIGCVTLRNSMYLLNLAEYAKLGISRTQLRNLEMTEASKEWAERLMNFAAAQ